MITLTCVISDNPVSMGYQNYATHLAPLSYFTLLFMFLHLFFFHVFLLLAVIAVNFEVFHPVVLQ
jgi:hypothetical protein